MTIAIVDYGSGNLHSAQKAFERAVTEAGLSVAVVVTSDPQVVAKAERIVLPGVGAYADCRRGLDAVPGMVGVLEEAVHKRGKPFLGICVGMQLLATRGLEYTTTRGLDWIGGDVTLIKPCDASCKIPHMGWNALEMKRPHALMRDIPTGENGLHAYFVHSYHFTVADPADCVATTDHGTPVTAMVARGNIAGTQFHPEKSQALGLKLISNFLKWSP
ncbi:MAG: imidazole glycerol phosphate synthase subunit HisH [Beijerinckiaceae bacterium]